MTLGREAVLQAARRILTEYGLGDLTMRRLAADLDVQVGAIYWHVPNKQALLTALADDLLAEVADPSPRKRWDRRLGALAESLRQVLLQLPDGAELVGAAHGGRLDDSPVGRQVFDIVTSAGHRPATARACRDALLHFVIGYTTEEQTQDAVRRHSTPAASSDEVARVGDSTAAFDAALAVVLRGIRATPLPTGRTRPPD